MAWSKSNVWEPELSATSWRQRGDKGYFRPWNHRSANLEGSIEELPLSAIEQLVDVLAHDVSDVRRDALLYANAIEELKRRALSGTEDTPDHQNDIEAGAVVARLQALGLASASLAQTAGGPPPVTGSRWFGGVVNWLIGKLGDVAEWLVRAARSLLLLLGRLFVDNDLGVTVSLVAGIPPALEFTLAGAASFRNPEISRRLDRFIRETYETAWWAPEPE